MKLETWRLGILSFESKKTFKNPFLDTSIIAVFTGPSHQKLVREAYWDGENSYKVSVALTEVGTWNYILCADEDTGLNQVCGELECIPYEGELDIYKHGFLKISDDRRYFTYNDGTPFFWLGDTHWEFSYGERWDESNHPTMTSQFKGMVDKRFEQGYTIYQTNLRSDAMMGGDKKYWSEYGTLPNIEFYQNELDRRMKYIADKGIVNALGFAWFMSILNNQEVYKNLARYFIARYGAYPMVWILAGEVGGYDLKTQSMFLEGWKPIAQYLYEMDTYHQPSTAHYTNERPFAHYYHDEDWFMFTLNQGGHGDYVVSVNDYKEFMKKYGDKPFVEGEAFYEFCSTLEENGTRLCTADMVRRVAYLTMQSGGCGYTYGAQGIWDIYWEKGDPQYIGGVFNKFEIPWYIAIDGIGGEQMGYMKKFYMDQKFWTLYPYQAGDDVQGDPFGKKMPLITVSKDAKHWVFYYPEACRKSSSIKGFNNESYTMCWFNPRTGQYSEKEEFTVTNGEWKFPSKPDMYDWCLVVKEKEK